MPPKTKTETVAPDETGAVDPMDHGDELATMLDTLAEHAERLDRIEAAQREAGDSDAARRRAAAARSDDPVFLATTGHGRRPRRMSEGERQDEIVTENARRHLHEPAGDGVVTNALTSGADRATDEPGEGAMEDPASPRFDERGEGGESVASGERE